MRQQVSEPTRSSGNVTQMTHKSRHLLNSEAFFAIMEGIQESNGTSDKIGRRTDFHRTSVDFHPEDFIEVGNNHFHKLIPADRVLHVSQV